MNKKGKEIVQRSIDNTNDRMDVDVVSNCFITIKDHKENFFFSFESMSHQSSKKLT